MKHVNILSKPGKADNETALVTLKNVFGFDLGFVDLSAPLDQDQSFWVLTQLNHCLTK